MDASHLGNDQVGGLDLNLLVTLNAILREESVTRAAAALRLTQPSVSVALRRLRTHFGDELLTRSGNTYTLTPVAVSLRENTAAALDAVRGVFTKEAVFNPATSSREFILRGSDYTAGMIGVAVVAEAERQAPGVNFRFMDVLGSGYDTELHTLDQCDGVFLPKGVLPGIPSVDVIKDHWVCLLSTENTVVGDELTLERLGDLPFVVTLQSRRAPQPAIAQLIMLGLTPRIACVVDSMLALALFIVNTDRVALVPSKLAPALMAGRPLRVLPCPYDAVNLTATFYWHPRFTQDPAHQWMRQLVRTAGRTVYDSPGGLRQLS